jgi:ABC-type glycerol-3-phosphate transport system permease component
MTGIPTQPHRKWHGALPLVSTVMLVTTVGMLMLPLLWMLLTAFKPAKLLFVEPLVVFYFPPAFSNFVDAWNSAPFGRFMLNTLLITTFTIAGSLASSSLVGYAFAVLKARGSRLFFGLLLVTLMVPTWTTLIPAFVLFSRVGITDSYLPMLLPAFMGQPLYVFLFRQSFRTLPPELFDAAEVDGCNPLQSFLHIALPLCGPVAATVAIFAFVTAWNDFLNPLVYLRSMDKFTLAIGLSYFTGPNFTRWHLQMAMSVIALAPVFLIVAATQKHLVRGLVVGGLNR